MRSSAHAHVTDIFSGIESEGYFRGFLPNPSAESLTEAIESLGIPHRHDQSDRYVWDIKPTDKDPSEAPRSHTSYAFPLHTDCSYEEFVPTGVALLTLREDRCGGGVSELLDTKPVLSAASSKLKEVLKTPYPIRVPQEFFKGQTRIFAPILSEEGGLRYREDLFIPELMSTVQREALYNLRILLADAPKITFSLKPGEVVFMDNTRMLHGRSAIKDPERHLLRIRFYLTPADSMAPAA